MGSARRRARDPLPVHGSRRQRRRRGARSPDGHVGLRATRNVATVRRTTDWGGRGARRVAVARGRAEPGGRALRGRVPRARRELA